MDPELKNKQTNKPQIRQGCPLSTSTQHCTGGSSSAMSQETEVKQIQIGNGKAGNKKLSLFTNNMIKYMEYPMESTKKKATRINKWV